MSKGLNLHAADGVIARDPSIGIVMAYGSNVPANNTPGYAPSCRFMKTNATSIGVTEYVNVGTKAACAFVQSGLGSVICVTYVYGDAAPIDGAIFVAERAYRVQSLIVRPTVAGTDGGAVTAQIRRAATGTAISGGSAIHSGTIDLKGAIDTNQVMTLLTTSVVVELAINAALGIDVTGTPTAARGVIVLTLIPQ